MKTSLLTLAFVSLLNAVSFGQTADFVQTGDNTGITYLGGNRENTGMTTSVWGSNCDGTAGAGGGGSNEDGPTLDFGWGLGSAGKIYNIIELTTPINLSATANQKAQVTLQNLDAASGGNALPLTYVFRLEDGTNASLLNDNSVTNINVTGTSTTFTIDFSGQTLAGKDLTSVKKIIFLYDGCAHSVVGASHLFLSNLTVGSTVVAGVNAAQNMIAESKVYPNPSSGLVNVQLDLKSTSNVKVVLNDLYGKEMKVVAEGTYSNLNETFNVSDLAKGVYTLTYVLNSAPAKTEVIMVK